MFELELNIYTIQNQPREDYFDYIFSEKLEKIEKYVLNTNLELSCACINDQTQTILHRCEGMLQ